LIFALLETGCREKPPPADLPTSCIAVYGDSRTHHSKHKRIVEGILKTHPEAVFHTGDLVTDADNRRQWEKAVEIISPIREVTDFFAVPGNHDKGTPLFVKYFDPPGDKTWYSVDRMGIHFIVLDTNEDLSESSEQIRWLISDLQNLTDSTRFTVAVFHIPLFTTGQNDPSRSLRKVLTPIFQEYGVDLVFNGHNHSYERLEVDGITYVVTGGGGASLYRRKKTDPRSLRFFRGYHFCTLENKGELLVVTAFDIRLRLIDQFKVTPRPKSLRTQSSNSHRAGNPAVRIDGLQSVGK
jgi:predicted phosphodiesterase